MLNRGILRASGCDSGQIARLTDLVFRIEAIPWGTASRTTQQDEQGVLSFVERLSLPDGLVAKGMIVAQNSALSRWDALGGLLTVESPRLSPLPTEESVDAVCIEIQAPLVPRMVEATAALYGRRFLGRTWIAPSQKASVVRLGEISGMNSTCINGMTIRTLIGKELLGSRNPYEPLFQIFERGVFIDWERWIFTNLHLRPLGNLPELDL